MQRHLGRAHIIVCAKKKCGNDDVNRVLVAPHYPKGITKMKKSGRNGLLYVLREWRACACCSGEDGGRGYSGGGVIGSRALYFTQREKGFAVERARTPERARVFDRGDAFST